MKFGGSSVGDAERIRNVAAIVARSPGRIVVVTSAMAGVTDMLIRATELAATRHTKELRAVLEDIVAKHRRTVDELAVPAERANEMRHAIDALGDELKESLEEIQAAAQCSSQQYDGVVSFGERFSIVVVAAAITNSGHSAEPVEATRLIVTSDHFTDAEPFLDKSTGRVVSVLGPLLDSNTIPVVTGFIGQTVDGKITTLGRGASDYTATILGYCLDAKQVWIWTDVTGVMTADPRLIPEAKTIAQLSYAEASELSYFGAKVLHPLTMVPASLKNIPIFIKNTFEPEQIGTRIAAHTDDGGVKAITVKSELSLLTVQGKGVTGVPSVAAKVFGALASERIDVYMISQASSEHNISFVVKGSSGVLAVEKVHSALVDEMSSKDVDIVQLKNGLSIVAVVGNDMYNLPGVTGKTFASMGVSGVEIIAISYGSSERSISFVVESADAVTAIKSLHHTFQLVKKR